MAAVDVPIWVPFAVALLVLLPAGALCLALWRGYGAARFLCLLICFLQLRFLVGVLVALASGVPTPLTSVLAAGSLLSSLVLQFVPSSRDWFQEHARIRRLGGPLGEGDQRCPTCGQRFNAGEYRLTVPHWLCSRCKSELPRPAAQEPVAGTPH
jgi:hypothetical protein